MSRSSDAPRALTVAELAGCVSGSVDGDGDALILGVSSIEDAQDGDIVFAENSQFLGQALQSRASAVVAFLDAVTPDKPLIKVENPRYAFARILDLFSPDVRAVPGVHPSAVIGQNVKIPLSATIGANVVLDDDVLIGERAIVMAGTYLGHGCVVGDDAILHPNVTIYHRCIIGARSIVHSGTVIGADGFGYMQIGGKSHKVPQIGIVRIGEDVEIGACTTIDRAKTGETVIGDRTKVDNLVQIAHNVKVGTDCVIVSQVGIAGSSVIESGVIIAGQAGVRDHTTIKSRAVVMGRAGVTANVDSGQVVSGYPARAHREKLKQDAALSRLPDTTRRLRQLEKAHYALLERTEALMRLVEEHRTTTENHS